MATWWYGSLEAALAGLRGDTLTVWPRYVDFGRGEPGEVLEATVEVSNWGSDDLKLIGGTSDCSCITTSNLPLSVPPGGTKAVTIQLNVPRSGGGTMTRFVELWTDAERHRTIRLLVGCRVR